MKMALIVVAGIADDEIFQQVAYIADYLSSVLPNFSFRQISKRKDAWAEWLGKECKKRGWRHSRSPIVWKELAMAGGRAVLLGGANGFWEYLKEYYDILYYINKEEKTALLLDKLKIFTKQEKDKEFLERDFKVRRICIVGAGHPMTTLLVMELLRMPELALKDGIVITLCDALQFEATLKRLVNDAATFMASPGFASVRTVGSLRCATYKCDLCIILLHADSERKGQELLPWLRHNFFKMLRVADALRARAPHHCRVILAAAGEVPLCFNAQVIADYVKNISVRNIVAVTSDLALESLRTLAKEANVPQSTIGTPPVWGFIGVNKLVDLFSAYHAVEVIQLDSGQTRKYVPGSTLHPGKKVMEVRNITYLLKDTKALHTKTRKRKLEAEVLLERPVYIAKVRAITHLLKHWYNNNTAVVLSLGVCSNGTFGLPHGIFFSQPVTLIDGKWRPHASFPSPRDYHVRLLDLLVLPMHILRYFQLGKRMSGIWLVVEYSNMVALSDKFQVSLTDVMKSKTLAAWRDKRKDLVSQQKSVAEATAMKLRELKEKQIRDIKKQKEEIKAAKFMKLKREKLISMMKQRNQEKNLKEAEEESEIQGEIDVEETSAIATEEEEDEENMSVHEEEQ